MAMNDATGRTPMEATSLRLTASAFQPMAYAGAVDSLKWTPSANMSVVMTVARPFVAGITAQSSPMPSPYGATADEDRFTRFMNSSSFIEIRLSRSTNIAI